MRRRVLIVDDNSSNRYLLQSLLEGEGMEVVTAGNGKEALEMTRTNPPDLIISDILMPVMDGYAFCRQCKLDEKLRHIPFVFYTATYTEPKDESFALSLGADRFILKPQEPEAIMDMLAEVWKESESKAHEPVKPLGEEMEFFRQYNEILFRKLEKKMLDLEGMSKELRMEEEELRRNEEFLNSVVENIPNMIFVKDAENLRFVRFNRAGEKLLGFNRQDLISKNDYDFFPKDQADFFIQKDREVLKNKQLVDIPEEFIQTKHLGERILHTKKIPIIDKDGESLYLLGISEDITELKRTEELLKKSEKKYRSIFENAVMGIFQVTIDGQYLSVNPAGAVMYGYESPEEMMKSVTDTARQIYVYPEERARLIAQLEASGSVEGFETEHYRKDGSKFWVLMNACLIRDEKGITLDYYEVTSQNITASKTAQEETRRTLERLHATLGATVQAMATTVETRDPYTAGHQRRVADLARAIAQEMNLFKDVVDGIRVAGLIHDIGKISVPAEILSKPTKLNEMEFNIIKVHPEAGYNILKDIEFPWPVADIVYQHHEKLNGAGYPQGLRDEQILLEAKILAVADAVEAMASHRPYRAGLGLDFALEEIEKNKGIFYEAKVVNACVRLFREKGYRFET
ncbi:MAG TPA: PAS domain S-box protein [Syntrophorhabdaceae bacterium]|nr:PAS domain S-box protein [Syntrophorhabdaceae bacterium]HQM80082.1 PAS domain S-box protein [Syntrophorhabdaceae bacterium]